MTKTLLTAALIFIASHSFAQTGTSQNTYDSALAKNLGADDYGMKKYVMAFLRSGPNRPTEKRISDSIQMAHLRNIIRLAKEGKLLLAGPFLDDQNIRGIFIFNVTTVEEARELASTDPAVKAGLLEMEFHPWYGPAALMQTVSENEKLQKKHIVD